MFKYTQSTFTAPKIFWGNFLIQNSVNFLSSSYQKKVRAVGSFLPQDQSKLADQKGRNNCDRQSLLQWGYHIYSKDHNFVCRKARDTQGLISIYQVPSDTSFTCCVFYRNTCVTSLSVTNNFYIYVTRQFKLLRPAEFILKFF